MCSQFLLQRNAKPLSQHETAMSQSWLQTITRRAGPEQGNQAEEPDVIGQFVDDARGRGGCQRVQSLEVDPSRCFRGNGTEEFQGVERVAGDETDEIGQRSKDMGDIAQLTRAVDLRMRGEDLFDERGSRSLQTDDEDRPRVGPDPAAPASEQVRMERGDHPVDEPGVTLRVVGPTQSRRGLRTARRWPFRAARRPESKDHVHQGRPPSQTAEKQRRRQARMGR